jgi:cell division protein FtsW
MLIGGFGVLILYLLLLFRFVVASHKANTLFGKLVVVGLGFPMIFQAMVNMASGRVIAGNGTDITADK